MEQTRKTVQWGRWGGGLAALAVVFSVGWYAAGNGKAAGDPPAAPAPADEGSTAISVHVAVPKPGGIERVCTQPGSVEPFESADLYAKLSGYLVEQKVDIGSRVKTGDVLARILVPEAEAQVKQDAAEVLRAEAKVDQMKAAIITAEADVGAATSAVALAKAEKKAKTSYRSYREKQRDRIAGLVSRMAIEAKLADEQQDQYQAALSAESAASEAISAAMQKVTASRARVAQAQADLKHAEAEVAASRAKLEKAQAMLDYTVIRSPYDGVVTKRNFFRGDFVRSADAGGDRAPVLAVERTDLMRVIVQVPELDVPFVDIGDPAVVMLDALPGVSYQTQGSEVVAVSRLAASEDPRTRTMRTEVDVKNTNGKLRRGMYSRVRLTLQNGAADALRIPSGALAGKAEGGKAEVRVVRNGTIHLAQVRYGADNGSEVEILSGLNPTDRVVLRTSGPVEQGTAVTISNDPS